MRASQSTREIGYSSAKPLPPWICSALSAAAHATRAAKQLGHARFEVAPPARVLRPRGEIGDLARDVDFHRHHGELVGDAGKMDDRLAELGALLGVAQTELEGGLSDPDGARRGLNAGRLESLHQLLETLALDAAEQALAGTSKPSKAISYSFMPR